MNELELTDDLVGADIGLNKNTILYLKIAEPKKSDNAEESSEKDNDNSNLLEKTVNVLQSENLSDPVDESHNESIQPEYKEEQVDESENKIIPSEPVEEAANDQQDKGFSSFNLSGFMSHRSMRDDEENEVESVKNLTEKFEKMMREEKSLLARMWSNEKKEILRKANEDRKELMLENTRLRKELSSSYSANNIGKIEKEKRDIIRRCQQLEKQNADSQNKLFHLQQSLENLKEKHEEEKRKWLEEKQNLQEEMQKLIQQMRIEQDKINSLKQSQQSKNLLEKEKQKWEEERQIIFNNWKQEIEILTIVARHERNTWYREKVELLKRIENDQQSNQKEKENQIEILKTNLNEAYAEIEHLQGDNARLQNRIDKMEEEYDRNLLLAQSADSVIKGLKSHINKILNGADSSHLLSNIVQEKAIVEKRAEKIIRENSLLRERFHEEIRKRKHLHNILEDMKGNIRVIIRMRPLLEGEKGGDYNFGKIEIKDEQNISAYTSAQGSKNYEFYRVLSETATQEEVFEDIKPLIQSAIDGYNVCIMAYGQTGSGKTYTIHGEEKGENIGVLPRTAIYLFELLGKYIYSGEEYNVSQQKVNTFSVKCSMIELYLDNIIDLLEDKNTSTANKKLDMRQHQNGHMFVQGVSEHAVKSPGNLLALLEYGNERRQIHKTEMNERSSRSHTIFTIYLSTSFNKGDGIVTTNSKLLFVDLAGSERISKSHSEGERFKEATHINKSLSALGDVIAALSDKKSFIPYRNSKLTLLLQDSIGGNSKTVMFANISPSYSNISETVSTLNFSSRVKTVQNQNFKNQQQK